MPRIHLTHFGVLEAETDGRAIRSSAWREDPDPRPIIDNVASSQHHPSRIRRPAVRRGYLEHGPGATNERGNDAFVEVSWDTALDLLARELVRVYTQFGSSAVYGESYGWSSAGRFHHGKSQVHRFLNSLGGFVRGAGDYSYGASRLFLPHVLGLDTPEIVSRSTSWRVIAEHTELFVAFGGMSDKNTSAASSGVGRHDTRGFIAEARRNGCEFVDITPIRDDTFVDAEAEWLPVRPGSDTALMLALAYVLDDEGLADATFLDRYTAGYDRFIAYVRGSEDGIPKTPEWSEPLTTVPAETVRNLARRMARSRTLINLTWSLQRQHHGEQPIWAGIALAAMLGQIGLPGGGFQHGYGSTANVGRAIRLAGPPSLPQGRNDEARFIPVTRISDMLLCPGTRIRFNGAELELPKIELVYWVGGNPFHHHQDLTKLHQAFQRPATVVVHEQFWTATARHADIVLPATMTIERDDFGAGRNDPLFFPMPRLTEPAGEAKDDYAIFVELEKRIAGSIETAFSFSEGRSVEEWLRHLYSNWSERVSRLGHAAPAFDDFWASDYIELPAADEDQTLMSDFRADPDAHALRTSTGRIELYSKTVEQSGHSDFPSHPQWMQPREWLGDPDRPYPLHLISNQPKTRLHSQLDVGSTSQASKISGREPARMNPADAARRGLSDGSVVRIFNDRGSCLAGLIVSDAISEGIVQLATGAWYDPDPSDPSFCRHGNPNVLTSDLPSSSLTQGTAAHTALVQVERWSGPLPPITVTTAPVFVEPA